MLKYLEELHLLVSNPVEVSDNTDNPSISNREFLDMVSNFIRRCVLKVSIFSVVRDRVGARLTPYLQREIGEIIRTLNRVIDQYRTLVEQYKVESVVDLEKFVEWSAQVNSISFSNGDNAQARMTRYNDRFITTMLSYTQKLKHIDFTPLCSKILDYQRQISSASAPVPIVDISRADTPEDRTYTGFKYMYDRKQLLKGYINKYQGTCDASGVTPKLIDEVRSALFKYRLIDETGETNEDKYKAVTINHVKTILRENNYESKHVDNASYILNQVRGYRTIFIEHLENDVLNDFAKFINAGADILELNKAQNKRKNLFSLNYILYLLLRRRGLQCSIDDFSVVKTIEKRMAYEEVCIEIFNKLEWSF